MSQKIKITILDDESLLVEAFSNLLVTNQNFEVINKYTNGNTFLKELENPNNLPDILLLDLNMQPINGLEVLEKLTQSNIELKVIVLSSMYNSTMYGYMIKYGICSFLPKYCEKDELFTAIEEVYKNKFYVNREGQTLINEYVKAKNGNPWNMIALTEREIDILQLICQEFSTKEISDKLFISPKTVEAHRSKIMEKIGCKNVVGMVTYAILNGIYVIKNNH
jgi:DNA-binding NarL/FixJ family response regulator